MELRGGYVVLNELLRRDYAEPGAITTRFSKRELAARYGLSRTHVIDLVAALEAEGWLTDGPLGPGPTDRMREDTRLWHGLHLGAAALVLSGMLMPTIEEALAARAASSPPPEQRHRHSPGRRAPAAVKTATNAKLPTRGQP